MKKKITTLINDNRIMLFMCTIIIGNIIFWIAAALTDWQSTRTTFFRWDHWSFMDWFTEFMRFNTGNIYTGDDIANYPAFCFLIFRLFYSFVPQSDGRLGDYYSIRTMQQTMVPFALLEVFLIFMFYHIFKYEMRNKTKWAQEGLAFSILISAPFLFVFERGNQIIIALLCTMLYVMLYDSDKRSLRIISYICLSVAAAIKIYPAVFGILTIEKKRYKEAIFLIILGAVTFLTPFAFFNGINGLITFINSILYFFDTYFDYGFGYYFIIYNLERLFLSLILGYQTSASNISIIVTFIVLVIAYIVAHETWQRYAVLALALILLPKFSYIYTVCFLAIPFIHMLKTKCKKIHYLYLAEFLLIYFPWLHFPIDKINFMNGEELSHTFSVGHVMMYIGLLGILITIIAEGLYCRFSKKHCLNKGESMENIIS